MKAFAAFLIICGISQVLSRSHGVRRDPICDDVSDDCLELKDDPQNCGEYIACVGKQSYHFKCFSDLVYSNGTAVCLACEDYDEDIYYENETGYGRERTTKKRFTYKQPKRTKSTTKKYGHPRKSSTVKYYPSEAESSNSCEFKLTLNQGKRRKMSLFFLPSS